MIIGITGTDGAGKGSVVNYLVEQKGFTHYSAREIWIEEIKRQGLEVNRPNMRLMGNKLRGEHGNDYLITYYYDKIAEEKPEKAIIESIRAVAEAEALKKKGGILLAVDADQKIRYERVQERRSESDKVTFAQFKEHEALEMNDPDPHGMQKAKVIEMADFVIENNADFDALHSQIDVFLREYISS